LKISKIDKYLHNKERQKMSEKVLTDSEKKKEDWMNTKWRPTMGWMYMLVCITDFVVFPVLWSMVQAIHGGQVSSQWNPITLQGAGLFHMAMGAILGIAVYGRTKEKLEGVNNGGAASIAHVPSFSAPAATTSATPVSSFSTGIAAGKAKPTEPHHPAI
jgi:hypothetical protein